MWLGQPISHFSPLSSPEHAKWRTQEDTTAKMKRLHAFKATQMVQGLHPQVDAK